MAEFVLADAAKRDLRAIADYTARQWGLVQADSYVDTIFEAFALAANFPEMGPARDDLSPGMRALVSGSHIIFYRIQSEDIGIARILHVKQDPAEHL